MLKLLSQIPRLWQKSPHVSSQPSHALGTRVLAPAASGAGRAPTACCGTRKRAKKLSATALTPAPVSIREKLHALRDTALPQTPADEPRYQQALSELDATITEYRLSSAHPDPDCRVDMVSQMQSFRALLDQSDSRTLTVMLGAWPAGAEVSVHSIRNEVADMLAQRQAQEVANTCGQELVRITGYLQLNSPIDTLGQRMLREVDAALAELAPKTGKWPWTFANVEQRSLLLQQLEKQPAAKLRAMVAAWGDVNLAARVDPSKQPVRAAILDTLRAHQAKYPKEAVAEAAMVDAISKFSKFGQAFLLKERPREGIDPQAQLINQLNALNRTARTHLHHLPIDNALLVRKTGLQPPQDPAARRGQIIYMAEVASPPPTQPHASDVAPQAAPLADTALVWDLDAMVSLKLQLNDFLRKIPLQNLDAVVANWKAERKGFDLRHNAVRHLVAGLAEELRSKPGASGVSREPTV